MCEEKEKNSSIRFDVDHELNLNLKLNEKRKANVKRSSKDVVEFSSGSDSKTFSIYLLHTIDLT